MEVLGFYIYPIPAGTEYTDVDLINSEKVIELFDYCQILEAVIYKEGWDFLIKKYGYNGLFDLDKKSGWFDCDSIEEFIQEIEYQRDISPKR